VPSTRLERLLAALREIGLFVVEVSELEQFVPTVGGHGPSWVNEVHERGLHADASLTQARAFVKSVAGSPFIQAATSALAYRDHLPGWY
jgi:hypothetical protein